MRKLLAVYGHKEISCRGPVLRVGDKPLEQSADARLAAIDSEAFS